ncbi:hypothetical protein BGX38DRAFT_604634 [Terfezia claveryi]|nr:hypothetical protein BGX38DRAFT_604634 [Terfezia claveryi]
MLPVSVATKFLGSAAAPNCLLTSHILRDLWSIVYLVSKHSQKTGESKVEELCEKLEDKHNTVLVSLNADSKAEKELWEVKLALSNSALKAEKELWEVRLTSSKELWEAKLDSSKTALKAEKELWEAKLALSENALSAIKKAHRDMTESHTDLVQAYKELNMELREEVAHLKSVLLASKSVDNYIRGRSVTRAIAWNSEPVESLFCPELVEHTRADGGRGRGSSGGLNRRT